MEKFQKKPRYSFQDEINKVIGHILWGNKDKSFSMRRLITGFMKKLLKIYLMMELN